MTTTRLGGEDERMGWWHLPSSVPAPTIPSEQLYIPYHTNGMTCHTRPHHTSIAMHQMYDLWYGMVPAPTIPSVHTISYYTIHHRSICAYIHTISYHDIPHPTICLSYIINLFQCIRGMIKGMVWSQLAPYHTP